MIEYKLKAFSRVAMVCKASSKVWILDYIRGMDIRIIVFDLHQIVFLKFYYEINTKKLKINQIGAIAIFWAKILSFINWSRSQRC